MAQKKIYPGRKIYFEASWRDGGKFGVAMDLGETERPIDYQMLAGSIDKGALLRACGLDGAVRPEDVTILTPEEYEREYGEEDC